MRRTSWASKLDYTKLGRVADVWSGSYFFNINLPFLIATFFLTVPKHKVTCIIDRYAKKKTSKFIRLQCCYPTERKNKTPSSTNLLVKLTKFHLKNNNKAKIAYYFFTCGVDQKHYFQHASWWNFKVGSHCCVCVC